MKRDELREIKKNLLEIKEEEIDEVIESNTIIEEICKLSSQNDEDYEILTAVSNIEKFCDFQLERYKKIKEYALNIKKEIECEGENIDPETLEMIVDEYNYYCKIFY